MPGEEGDAAPELVAGRVRARHEDSFGEHHELVGREPVAGLLDGDQLAQQIVARIVTTFVHHAPHVGVELRRGSLDNGQVRRQILVEDPEDVARPAREQAPVLCRRSQQLADDGDRIGLAHLRYELARATARHRIDEPRDGLADERAVPLGCGRREGRRDEPPQPGVLDAVHRQDRAPAPAEVAALLGSGLPGEHRECRMQPAVAQHRPSVLVGHHRETHRRPRQPALPAGGHRLPEGRLAGEARRVEERKIERVDRDAHRQESLRRRPPRGRAARGRRRDDGGTRPTTERRSAARARQRRARPLRRRRRHQPRLLRRLPPAPACPPY